MKSQQNKFKYSFANLFIIGLSLYCIVLSFSVIEMLFVPITAIVVFWYSLLLEDEVQIEQSEILIINKFRFWKKIRKINKKNIQFIEIHDIDKGRVTKWLKFKLNINAKKKRIYACLSGYSREDMEMLIFEIQNSRIPYSIRTEAPLFEFRWW